MQTEPFHEHSIKQSKGSVNPYVNFSDLAWYEFPLPPLEEQRKIANALRATSECTERLRELCVRSSKLLESAVDDMAAKANRAGSPAQLDQLIEKGRPITYGILKPGLSFPGGVPVIKVKDFPDGHVQEDGLLLTDPKIDEEYKRSRLREGDLLISIRGTIGRLAFVPASLKGANITQDTARLSLRADNSPTYVHAMLSSSFVRRQLTEFTTGLAVQGINIGELRKVLVPIAGRDQQEELVHEVAEIRIAIERCKERLEASRAVHRAMLRELS